MMADWLRILRRRFVRPAGAPRREAVRRRFVRLALEGLEDRVTPSSAPLAVASYFDSAIYEFNSSTGTLMNTLVAPYSQPSTLSGPAGITVGPDGNLYISSQNTDSIVEYNLSTQSLSTFINLSTGFAPAGLQFGPDGNLYVSENGGQSAGAGSGAVVRFDIAVNGGVVTYTGTSTTVLSGLSQPTEMTFGTAPNDLNNLYVSNSAADTVVKITDATGIANATPASPTVNISFIAPSHATPDGNLQYPAGLTWGSNGKLYVVDDGGFTSTHGQVLEFNANGTFNSVFSHPSSALNSQYPSDAVFNSAGQLLTANLGPVPSQTNPTLNLQGSVDEFGTGGTLLKTLVSSSAFPDTGGPGESGISPSQLTLNLGTLAPTVSISGNYSLNEGSSLTLHALGADPNGYPLTYSWDVNGDGTYGDATGANPTLSWSQLIALGVDHSGTFNVTVMASDGHGQVVTSAPVTLTVNYVPAPVPTMVVTSFFDGAVYEFNAATGKLLDTLVAPYSNQSTLTNPADVTDGPDGNLYISNQDFYGDPGSNSIVVENLATNTLSSPRSSRRPCCSQLHRPSAMRPSTRPVWPLGRTATSMWPSTAVISPARRAFAR